MTAKTHIRGHETEFNKEKGEWVYSDTKEPILKNRFQYKVRPCKRCGRMPTKEGHDACLGFIPGVKSACCGHGVEERHILKENIQKIKVAKPQEEIENGRNSKIF